ncbi:MAG: hypothetical protein M5T61_06520 [Acidimicrobiia bacterium]|nr:hypothetical protein [Acidimicrobiia bacterium]
MAFREVPVFEVREVLRLWMDGRGLRSIAAVTRPDRKTVRRVVDVAVGLGLDRGGEVGQLDDVFVSSVMAELAVARPDRHGESWAVIAGEHDRIVGWVKERVPVVKMCELLARRSVVVPERTLHRYVAEHFGSSSSEESTVLLADCEPGAELQVDWAMSPASSSIATRAGGGRCGRCCSLRCSAGTASCGCRTPRRSTR